MGCGDPKGNRRGLVVGRRRPNNGAGTALLQERTPRGVRGAVGAVTRVVSSVTTGLGISISLEFLKARNNSV